MQTGYEVAVPFQYAPGQTPAVTRVRSTLLAASLQGIREMGWESRYFAALPREHHEEMQMMTPGFWVPADMGAVHYTACDAMGLTDAEMTAIGEAVSMKTQGTFVGVLGKAATGAGATPWLLFQSIHRIWGRMIEGADNGVFKVGPKDSLVCLVGCSLADLTYFRVGLIGYYRAIAKVLSRVAYTREIRDDRAPGTLTFRMSWV